jgi:hypothetical protein
MSSSPPPGDPEIFSKGVAFLIVHEYGSSAWNLEQLVEKIRADSDVQDCGDRVDWSFLGGRAVFRVIGNIYRAQRIARDHIPTTWRYEILNGDEVLK